MVLVFGTARHSSSVESSVDQIDYVSITHPPLPLIVEELEMSTQR
jgi:hypothetical protein